MMMQQILTEVRAFDGVLELAPTPGSEHPELSWGDHFFYYAPDGEVPRAQPYATIVTKDYPEDTSSRLAMPDRWRVNIHVGRATLTDLLGEDPQPAADPSRADELILHPVYGDWGWVAVVNPGERTGGTVRTLLRQAHDDARGRVDRRVRRTDWSD